jgi:hypothetical protein
MTRLIDTHDDAHARDVARALIRAAHDAGKDATAVRTVTGTNGRQAFEVDDDFPDVTVPEPDTDEDEAGGGDEQEQPRRQARQAAKKTAAAPEPAATNGDTTNGDTTNGGTTK